MGRAGWWRVLGALFAFTMLAAACGDDDDGGGTTATTAAPVGGDEGGAQDISITAVDYEFQDVPTDLRAGVVNLTFDNQGDTDHDVAFVEIGDTGLEEFLEAFAPVVSGEGGGPIPDYAENVSSPIRIPGGESADVTFTVNEGTFAMICTLTGVAGDEEAEGEPHFNLGMAEVVEISAGEDNADLPEADGTITARDWSFEPDVADGDSLVTFLNEGPNEIHFASVSVFPEGITAEQAETAFQALITAEAGAPPPEGTPEPEDVGFSGVFSTGLGSNFELQGGTFESGRTYLLTCFISDRAGGPPHAIAHDMYMAFTVD